MNIEALVRAIVEEPWNTSIDPDKRVKFVLARYSELTGDKMSPTDHIIDANEKSAPSGEDVGIQRKITKAGFVGIDTMIQCLDARKNTINTQAQRIAELEAELTEQCRLHGLGANREAKMQTRIAKLEAELRDALAEIGVAPHSSVQVRLHERIAELATERDRYREALEKIASHNSDHPSAVWLQKIARAALEGK